MKSKIYGAQLVGALALAFTFGSLHAAEAGYAEKIYSEYSDSSGGSVEFKTFEIDRGPLKAIQGLEFGELIAAPSRVLRAYDDGFRTSNHEQVLAKADSSEFSDLRARAEDLADVGYPVSSGQFRILHVEMSVDGKTSDHEALELCWSEQNYCYLLDYNVEFIDSVANNRIRLRADGVGPTSNFEVARNDERAGEASTAGTCGLAVNPEWIARWVTWPERDLRYRNVFGNTLVTKNLGEVRSGVRCDTQCRAQPFGHSYSSSASGRLGWRTACDNDFNSGTNASQSTAKFTGITGCSRRYAAAAKFIVTKKGVGTGVDLDVDVGGSSDRSGGFIVESCGYF